MHVQWEMVRVSLVRARLAFSGCQTELSLLKDPIATCHCQSMFTLLTLQTRSVYLLLSHK